MDDAVDPNLRAGSDAGAGKDRGAGGLLYRSRQDALRRCAENGIVVEAYSPFTKGRRLADPTLGRIAAEVDRTPAQVLIRWALHKELVVLPRSSNAGRIAENAAVFDFDLDDSQVAGLDALDEGLTTGWDPASQA